MPFSQLLRALVAFLARLFRALFAPWSRPGRARSATFSHSVCSSVAPWPHFLRASFRALFAPWSRRPRIPGAPVRRPVPGGLLLSLCPGLHGRPPFALGHSAESLCRRDDNQKIFSGCPGAVIGLVCLWPGAGRRPHVAPALRQSQPCRQHWLILYKKHEKINRTPGTDVTEPTVKRV